VLVVMEHASRRIIHLNVTAHPNAAWTLQQLREAIPSDHRYRFILHDRDAIFSTGFDASLARMGLEVIATPVRSPKANSLCERLIGTLRRECLDWIIPLTEQHLRKTLWSWLPHYNRGRPHSSLGPGLPDPPLNLPVQFQRQRASFRPIEPSCGALRPERTSPRVQPLGPCCMMSLSFCGRQFVDPRYAVRNKLAWGGQTHYYGRLIGPRRARQAIGQRRPDGVDGFCLAISGPYVDGVDQQGALDADAISRCASREHAPPGTAARFHATAPGRMISLGSQSSLMNRR
jgi:hypothetical protein